MLLKRKGWVMFLLLTAVVSLFFLSSGISTTEMSPEWQLFRDNTEGNQRAAAGSIDELRQRLSTIPDVILQLLYLTSILILPILIVFSIFSPEVRRTIFNEIKRVIPFVLWIATLAYLFKRIQINKNSNNLGTTSTPDLPTWIADPPLLVTLSIGVILIGTVVLAGWLVWRRLHSYHPLGKIALEAHMTIDEIESGRDFTNAVIECYARMCAVLHQELRIIREQGMTPREFASRLGHLGLAAEQTQQLTRLFEKVRYSSVTPTKLEQRRAIVCLEAIVAEVNEQNG